MLKRRQATIFDYIDGPAKPKTGPLNVLELYAGSRSIGKMAEKYGHNVFSVDWKPFDGIDLVADISKMTMDDVPWTPDVVWASPDCTTYSVAAVSKHRKGGVDPTSEYATQCDMTNERMIRMLKEWLTINPYMVFFIENPRGMMRKMPFMSKLPANTQRHTVWYCQYGENRAKPTDIWTNDKKWTPRPECWNGNKNCHHQPAPRGARTGTQGIKGTYDKSKIPTQLCVDVVKALSETFI